MTLSKLFYLLRENSTLYKKIDSVKTTFHSVQKDHSVKNKFYSHVSLTTNKYCKKYYFRFCSSNLPFKDVKFLQNRLCRKLEIKSNLIC